jgi:hypothetical protein
MLKLTRDEHDVVFLLVVRAMAGGVRVFDGAREQPVDLLCDISAKMCEAEKDFDSPNPEKAADTSAKLITVDGVTVVSRYGKADEILLMTKVLLTLSTYERAVITQLFCDSKAMSCYSASLRSRFDRSEVAQALAETLGRAFREHGGGHNGVYVGETASVDADWGDE